MANDSRLLKLMIAHHGLIEALLAVFKDNLSDLEKAQKALDDFRWQTEKHFFAEEKINFRFVFYTQEDLYKITQHLIEEHSQILGMMNRIERQLQEKKKIELDALSDLLQRHRETEEKILYPKMDEFLSQHQKDLIIGRINEVALKIND
ncbi:MAG: hypothetical protein A3A10_02895 [Candidatus Tagabacteria bacterium RIFCSPLOWO2_01_FULL_42_9]|uniref:Hemerythrin-like domain-containing protein n=1 Tax=Candidatus Tagabacteria bacterium RIFCSPLOWO2_01_FULL_42_9 TaxID=1802296 RepID=A0A1G2LVS8_9BACT|nr:MAG: hypothetical protein A3A10_02895 [Candidatus Tagabacteria bacterium RIFCSPLOWO2_01_FULL_42_9]